MSEIYMTRETIDKLKDELEYLRTKKRREIS
ncbi:transcription elongation factor GreA, partial [Candidatus Desantisbacteria bacterium CG_4_9_14_3_um_filter_40_11]